MLLGTLIALLLAQLGSFMRLLITTGLVLVWAMPPVVSVNIWTWMVDYEFGVANWVLSHLGLEYFDHHDWFVNPWEGFAVIAAIVVWGAIPFVAITIYAGLTQVPRELVEAASIDGSNAFRIFRDITLPILKPIFVILTSLSVIWNFQVFSQIWIIRNARPESEYFVMGIYSFVTSFSVSNYGLGSAIAIVMVLVDALRDVRLHPPDGADRGDRLSTVVAPDFRAAAAAAAAGSGAPRRAQPDRAPCLRPDGLPGLLDGLDRVQAGQRRAQLRAAVGCRSTRRSRTSATRSAGRTSGTTSRTA